MGVLKSVLSNRGFRIRAKKCPYEGVIIPMALCGAEAWGMRSAERMKVNVLEMKCLTSLVGVSRMDRVRNEKVRRRAGIERDLASRADQRVSRCFVHVERMDEYRMARRVLMAKVSGGWVRRRPRLGWMDGVMVALGNRAMTVEGARQCAKYRKGYQLLPIFRALGACFTRPFLFGPVFFRTAHPCSCGYHPERGGMPLHDVVGVNC